MKNLIQAAVVTLFAASTAQAQQAVQWKVSDGGNGHWYACVRDGAGMTAQDAANQAAAAGAHLLTGCSSEFDFAVAAVDALNPAGWVAWGDHRWGPWIGLRRVGTTENFEWVDGTSCVFDRWDSGAGQPDPANEDSVLLYSTSPQPSAYCHDIAGSRLTNSAILEWSSDCNSDGIVDYGQCHDGTLADYNGNNIPDCCERGEACVVGNCPVQWRVEDGGNGHWYRLVFDGHPSWTEAKQLAEQLGGYLATLTSKSENDLGGVLSRGATAMLLGGFQDRASQDYSEPAGGWRWITGEPWTFTNWGSGEPNDANNGHGDPGEDYLSSWTGGQGFRWGDGDNICPECNPGPFLVEWSADCNNDNIVDYGQILQGQLADLDSNGVPDICQQPTCVAADIYRDFNVNGADLGILLSQWGPNTPLTESDLNSDGVVNGADLGILLSFWGACP
jgi:hypothetical protein